MGPDHSRQSSSSPKPLRRPRGSARGPTSQVRAADVSGMGVSMEELAANNVVTTKQAGKMPLTKMPLTLLKAN
ncbi:hypothetical protein GCM10010510_44270 [Streptomyces anandii JCM 4720]|nr:hypothetical protein GCM10010510_44270 [Streptomyces anandii JCM 4720]